MLFDRFIFVLYLLFSYNWFLLGYEYDSGLKYAPIAILLLSLCIVSVITLMQLQFVVKQTRFQSHEIWATVLWSFVHITICILILCDAMELANILVIGMILGLLLSVVIITVGTCSCYVIMLNGIEWYSHLHLTCISFWILIQFMDVRLPSTELHYTSTVAIISMFILRMVEAYFHFMDNNVIIEAILWSTCIALHIIYDTNGMTKLTFFWGTTVTLAGLIVFNKYLFAALTMISLPFIIIPIFVYIVYRWKHGSTFEHTFKDLTKIYEHWTATPQPEILPFEIEETEEDWQQSL
jgi:hypothetical protein